MEKFFGGDGSGHFIISLALIWTLEQALEAQKTQRGLIAKAAEEAKEINRKGHKEGKGFYWYQNPGPIH